VLFFDGVVHGEVVAELLAHGEELLDGHVARAFLRFARGVEDVPGHAEVGVEVVHVLGHPIELTEFDGGEFGERFFLGSGGRVDGW
jgi:hypothetical protein